MKTLRQQIEILRDLDQQKTRVMTRFYSQENQALLLKEISRELQNLNFTKIKNEELAYLKNEIKLGTDIGKLLSIYKKLLISNTDFFYK